MPGAAALKKADLSLVLTNNEKIRVLNRDWRHKDKPTDVLSFPQFEISDLKKMGLAAKRPGFGPWTLGDIVISLERAREQAEEKNIRFHAELELLLVHGILHLLGFDHETNEKDAQRMRRMELKLLTR